MTTGSIIKLDNALSAAMSCIPLYEDDWDSVPVSELYKIKELLGNSYEHFQELISEDRKENGLNFQHVINICRSLKKYSSWFFLCQSAFKADKMSHVEDIRNKAVLAEIIYLQIEILWIAYLRQTYPDTKEYLLPKLSILDSVEIRKERKYEELRKEETNQVYSYFNGNTREKEQRLNILFSAINGKGGKEVALFEAAAVNLGWLTGPINWKSLKDYFGVKGGHQNISNYYNSTNNKLDPKEIKRFENELLRLSDR